MHLVIDVGNTNSVVGLFVDNELQYQWRISSHITRTEDEFWALISTFLNRAQLLAQDIERVTISSVVPNLTYIFKQMVSKYLNLEPLIITASLRMDMPIRYSDPQAVGADRLCNAVAGIRKYGTPLIILDFGTATTFDCIDAQGAYLGGVICPGIESAASVLHHKAAKLPKIELKFPAKVIGQTTEISMQSGIMHGTVEMVNGLVKMIKNELGQEARVIATGGLASVIADHTESIDTVDEYLNLEGIHLIAEMNS
jgi:type III pantothenate kinase